MFGAFRNVTAYDIFGLVGGAVTDNEHRARTYATIARAEYDECETAGRGRQVRKNRDRAVFVPVRGGLDR